MTSWSNLTGLEDRNKKILGGKEFTCQHCRKNSLFENLMVSIISSGYDYLCPKCKRIVFTCEDIENGKWKNYLSKKYINRTKVRVLSIERFPKVEDGECSKPYWIIAQEFGQKPVTVLCRGWKLKGQKIKFYLDRERYNIPNLRELAETPIYFITPSVEDL